ncbi:hypothetical protein H0H81_001774, partial [Sphagnurus paluster]
DLFQTKEQIQSIRLRYMNRLAVTAIMFRDFRRTIIELIRCSYWNASPPIIEFALERANASRAQARSSFMVLEYYRELFKAHLNVQLPSHTFLVINDNWLADLGQYGLMDLPLGKPIFPKRPRDL